MSPEGYISSVDALNWCLDRTLEKEELQSHQGQPKLASDPDKHVEVSSLPKLRKTRTWIITGLSMFPEGYILSLWCT